MPRKSTPAPEILAPLVPEVVPATEVALIEIPENPVALLTNAEEFDIFLARVKAATDTLIPDTSTKKGRDAIRTMAGKVVTTKTTLDATRLTLTKQWRDQTNAVNSAWKGIEEKLNAHRDEVRAPLTIWEKAEKDRQDRNAAVRAAISEAAAISWDDDSDAIMLRINHLDQVAIGEADFQLETSDVRAERERVRVMLSAAHAKALAAEDAAAELARLREAEAARLEAERIAQELAREAETARLAAEAETERQRLAVERESANAKAAEEARQAQIAQAREDAAREAREAAEREAQAERDRIQREADDAEAARNAVDAKRTYARQIIAHIQEVGLGMIGGQPQPYGILLHELTKKIVIDDDMGDMQDDVRAVRDATLKSVEAAMERQAERAQREEDDARAQQAAAVQRAKDEDRANRSAVMKAMKEAFMQHASIDESAAKRVVLAITGKHIPNCEVTW